MHWYSAIQLDRSDFYIAITVALIVFLLTKKQAPSDFWEQFWNHFTVIVLLVMFALGLGVVLHMSHDKADAASLQWAEGVVTGIIGTIALALGIKKEPLNGNGKTPPLQPDTPTAPNSSKGIGNI